MTHNSSNYDRIKALGKDPRNKYPSGSFPKIIMSKNILFLLIFISVIVLLILLNKSLLFPYMTSKNISDTSEFNSGQIFRSPQLEVAIAIDNGNSELTLSLASKLTPVELNAYGNENMTLLRYSAHKAIPETDRQLSIVTALLRAGADALQKSGPKNGGSILSVALLRAEGGKGPAFLKAVLDGGVSPDSLEYHGSETPIIFRLVSQDTTESLKLLVERGANVNVRDSLGRTPIMYGLGTFALDEVNYLIDHGADPKAVDLLGESFASRLEHRIKTQQNDPLNRYPKIVALRERIIRMGVEWPPVSELEERDRMRERGIKPIVPYGMER